MTHYRRRVEQERQSQSRFAGLYATNGGQAVRAVFVGDGGLVRCHTVEAAPASEAGDQPSVPSIIDVFPSAAWDEREAHDLYGLGFSGHEPLRPLVDHSQSLDHWTAPVRGRGTYQVAVGPVHAGVIESGHFRFRVVGDRVLHVDAQLFYKHRGLEKAAEGATLSEGMAFVARACSACSVTNAIAYASACEEICGLRPTAELSRARTILVELERVWNHLNDIAAICAGVGLAAGNNAFAALTERARRLNADLSGHRFLRGAVLFGRSELDWDAATVGDAAGRLAGLQADAARFWRDLAFNASFQDRLAGVGTVDRATASSLGVVGPAARAAGLAEDARLQAPLLSYPDFAPVEPAQPAGDVRARYEQRALELWQSFALLDGHLDRPLEPSRADPVLAPAVEDERGERLGTGIVEGPRGRTVCVVEAEGDRVRRLHLRTASFANWPAVAAAAAGSLLPDFPLINKSFELCYACVDR